MGRYVIRGGEEGYERLLVLARDLWPSTFALFGRAGLSPGMRCTDVGCGGGAVTLEIARLVARPGGVLIVEDADFDGWCCHPPDDGFDFFVRTYAQVLQRRGGDHAIGRKLYGYFADAGIPDPQLALVQSALLVGEGKTLAWSTLEATTEAIVSEGVATRDDVTAALTALQRFTADPAALICGPRIFQLWSRRPRPGSAARASAGETGHHAGAASRAR